MRPFAFALFALVFAVPAFAADGPAPNRTAPERLLPPSTQLFVRWDGIGAHNEAYKKSIWGGLMAGPTGDGIRTLLARGPKLLGSSVLSDLDGRSPAELKADLADLKKVEKVIELLADKGVIVAAEVREPTPTLKGIGRALGGLIDGDLPATDVLAPDAQMIVVVPDLGDQAEVLFGTLRLVLKNSNAKIEPFETLGRKGFYLPPDDSPLGRVHTAWWVEGKHFVLYLGTHKPADVVAEMSANAEKGGLTGHPLFQRCQKLGSGRGTQGEPVPSSFESVARGFVDTERVINLAKNLAGPFVPGLKERLDSTGISGVKALVFSSGFEGKESRAVWEFDMPGERKGLTKALKNVPLGLNDLPPMPPDVSRFSALRLDLSATYDAGLGLFEFLAMNADFGMEEEAARKNSSAGIKDRRAHLAREADKVLGLSVTEELLPHLGDKLVVFQSPSEGLQVFGTVMCISVKDSEKVKTALGRIQRGLEASANTKVKKKVLKGVEYREFYARGFGGVTPTYAIVGDWLVIATHPQAVQGLILRSKGDLEKWAPDAATAKRLAAMPAGCGLQYCDPKGTAATLCILGSVFFSTLNVEDGSDETDFDPLDVGLVPNAHELSKHLFPNLTVTRDDGKTIRIDVNESFGLPLEWIGVEPLGFLAGFLFYAGLVPL